ncbi:Store-operated calcium entry regulator [Babesia duncani]|uniref:Store-operated calcium entry regulator n=1 Tax=Babesia duncani TaxID=323732 RepID=A0AAD9UMK5_9APIC|nr:Store-operated calcium entry regulator [Babesia duncani]KAK2197883.1 Store-operated calcium entry regulator [Babesia duncani]
MCAAMGSGASGAASKGIRELVTSAGLEHPTLSPSGHLLKSLENAAPGVEPVCTLLPGLFGVSIQLLLCVISVGILFVKYIFEVPKRPPKVFIMDFIQLMCGSSTVHVLNILSSILINKFQSSPTTFVRDECNMYFMTTLVDATVGVYLEYKIVRYLAIRRAARDYLLMTRKSKFKPSVRELEDATKLATAAMAEDVQVYEIDPQPSLDYDDEEMSLMEHEISLTSLQTPNGRVKAMEVLRYIFGILVSPSEWLQREENSEFVNNLSTWLAIVCGLKLVTVLVFFLVAHWVNMVAAVILGVFNGQHRLKLFFVMIGAPLVFNVFQYYVTDAIIKIRAPKIPLNAP